MTFTGLTEEDFGDLRGSSWRNPNSLAGELVGRLRENVGNDCDSWGVARRLELHIGQRRHYDFGNPHPYPKLFVYTLGDELAYGFYIEGNAGPEYTYLHHFLQMMQSDSPLRSAVRSALASHDLYASDYYRAAEDGGALKSQFRSRHGKIEVSVPGVKPSWQPASFDALCQALEQTKDSKWLDFHIFARTPMQQAVQRQRAILDDLLPVLVDLARVYKQAIRIEQPTLRT